MATQEEIVTAFSPDSPPRIALIARTRIATEGWATRASGSDGGVAQFAGDLAAQLSELADALEAATPDREKLIEVLGRYGSFESDHSDFEEQADAVLALIGGV